MSSNTNTHLFASNAHFIEELYEKFLNDPLSVDKSWVEYFNSIQDNSETVKNNKKTPSWKKNIQNIDKLESKPDNLTGETLGLLNKVNNLILSYKMYGHTSVNLDPLNLKKSIKNEELDYKFWGINEKDLKISINYKDKSLSIENIISSLKNAYSSAIGAEFYHLSKRQERIWFEEVLENSTVESMITNQERVDILNDLVEAEMFENYLHTKFPGAKRFSVEGLEGSIAALNIIIKESSKHDVEECVLGMAHRGRLNTLTKIMGKPYHCMFAEFKGQMPFPSDMNVPGDVKYHMGYSSDVVIGDKKIHMTLTPNPSHLEVVNPIVLGKVRAKQDMKKDLNRNHILGILIHGDAAFIGQGTVMESLSLSQLKAYHTGGTIHIVSNNQIGFTTNENDSRYARYATEIGKFADIPIIHVNGDDAEAINFACKIACRYRSKFKKDVIIDVVGYRKYGHNEGDEPMFTQPQMYEVIKNKRAPYEIYAEFLMKNNIINKEFLDKKKSNFKIILDDEFAISQTYKPQKADWLENHWSHIKANGGKQDPITGVDIEKLKALGKKLSHLPDAFLVNHKIERQMEAKSLMFDGVSSLDWSAGEAIAMATLLDEGFNIRMTGQDVQRGTFSHRHAVITDQKTEKKYCPLNNLKQEQTAFLEIENSNLSEFAVLGFEYGYSFTSPDTITIWEAQFGDFANGAQVIIDQYISSAEAKWLRLSSLVMLLPHGYEGQGPEHSSARIERFLQLCSMDNMQVINPTTPASLFHFLRRQMHQETRKPLIVFSPKSLLRHKLAVSDLSEFAIGTKCSLVIGEKNVKNVDVKVCILCSGKVYYDLYEKREQVGRTDIAIVRIEQLYPFPEQELALEIAKYKNAKFIWCQEEHKNMGAYNFVLPYIKDVIKNSDIKYAGRKSSASPAVGYMKLHMQEHEEILKEIFGE